MITDYPSKTKENLHHRSLTLQPHPTISTLARTHQGLIDCSLLETSHCMESSQQSRPLHSGLLNFIQSNRVLLLDISLSLVASYLSASKP